MIRTFESTAHPIPTGKNLLILVAQLAAVFALFALAALAQAWWHVALLALAFGVLMNSVYSTIHEAEHAMLFPSRRWNDLAGSLMALFFPAPFHLIRQGHLGHHLRNRSDDEAFDLYFEGEHPVWKALILYGILTGCYYLVVALSNVVVLFFPFVMKKDLFEFDRPSAAFMEALNPKYKRIIALEGAAAIALHVTTVWAMSVPVLTYLALYAAFGFMWSAMQYVHHYGTERHVTKGARNLWIWRPLDALWLNHNWHQTHHEHPTVPWTYLPGIGRGVNPHRGFLPFAYLKMWRGPRLAKDRVENKYAGRVIH